MRYILFMFGVVFLGGVAGGFCRWLLTRLIPNPRGATFAANIGASAIIGASVAAPGLWQVAASVGFAGALSTLALLARQIGELIQAKHYLHAAAYGLATAVFGILAAAAGVRLGAIA